jgi:hypothetical protein
MEREDKSKKVVKEKRSVKKTKALAESGETIPVAETKKASPRKRRTADPATTTEKNIQDPTVEQIQLRAYFIGQKRVSLGIAGDSTSDWVQAEWELKEEAQKS